MLKIIAPLLVMVLFFSCDSNTVVSESKSLSGIWNKNETIEFTMPQLDSLKKYNLFVNLRNTNDYRFNNVFLIISTKVLKISLNIPKKLIKILPNVFKSFCIINSL